MSRKSLVPIQLPADPVNPLEAATKQYVDNQDNVTSEVVISTTQPTDPNNYDLWYNPNA